VAFDRIVVAWLFVTLWFLLWDEGSRRIEVQRGLRISNGPSTIARRLTPAVAEGFVLALFAALWFGSLGHGGWGLLFTTLGLLIEVPARLRDERPVPRRWLAVGGRVLRIVVAGALLAWGLGEGVKQV
jgi:hypothetical protein